MERERLLRPRCGRMDMVQKVSSLYAEQTQDRQYGFPGTQTRLAQRLAPPRRPARAQDSGCISIGMWSVFGFLTVAGVMALVLGLIGGTADICFFG